MPRQDIAKLVAEPLRVVRSTLAGLSTNLPVIADALEACTLSHARTREAFERGEAAQLHTALQQIASANMQLQLATVDDHPAHICAAMSKAGRHFYLAQELLLQAIVRIGPKATALFAQEPAVYPINSVEAQILQQLGKRNGMTRPELFKACDLAETVGDIATALHPLLQTNQVFELAGIYRINTQLKKAA